MKNEKTVLEWLSHLPEPYKSQAIEKYDPEYFDPKNNYRYDKNPVANAIRNAFHWGCSDDEFIYWADIHTRAENGEFDAPPIPWPAEADWSNAPKGTYARAVNSDGRCYHYMLTPQIRLFEASTWVESRRPCGQITDMTNIDWKQSFEIKP